MPFYVQLDPDAALTWTLDMQTQGWLAAGDTLVSATWTAVDPEISMLHFYNDEVFLGEINRGVYIFDDLGNYKLLTAKIGELVIKSKIASKFVTSVCESDALEARFFFAKYELGFIT